jgi:hypothetical protein
VGGLSFSWWQENIQPLLTHEPAVYGKKTSLTLCQRALRLATSTDGKTITRTLYDYASSMHLLGSASWCTRYGSERNWTYSNQPIFLFPEQNVRKFD